MDETDEVELPRVSRNVYRSSDNKRLNNLVAEKKEEAVYRKKNRFVGWKVFDKSDYQRGGLSRLERLKRKYKSQAGDEMKVKLDIEHNALGILGPPGMGKTVLLRGISNRGFLADVPGIHLADVKGDMYSNNRKGGIQKKLSNLRPNEDPRQIPTKMLMPKFIEEYSENVEYWNDFFWFDFDDLTEKDFMTMMEATEKTRPHIQKIYDLQEDGEIYVSDESKGGDYVLDWLEEEDIHYSHKRNIKTQLENMANRSVVASNCEINVPELVADNEEFISINMKGHEDISSGFGQMYVGKNMRDLVNDKLDRDGSLSESAPVELYLDEAHEFLEDGNVAEHWIRKAVKKRRNLGFRFIWATHRLTDFDGFSSGNNRPDDLPEIVFSTHHFCIAPAFGASPSQIILKHCGCWMTRDSDKWRSIFGLMRELREKGIYVWLYVNRDGDWAVFESASSIANHG